MADMKTISDGNNTYNIFDAGAARKTEVGNPASLTTGKKDNLVNAINELNSKKIKKTRIRITTQKNTPVRITNENVKFIEGAFPETDTWIPVLIGHSSDNNCFENIFYDYPNWVIVSSMTQDVTIFFYDVSTAISK